MNWTHSARYREDLETVSSANISWQQLSDKTILITGATGMIGSFLVDVIMYHNKHFQQNCSILAVGRNEEKAKMRFAPYWDNPQFSFFSRDINNAIDIPTSADFIIHAASNTHPLAYATDPIGTILTNVQGTYNLLSWAKTQVSCRFLFVSSVEVYGENRGDVEKFDESYLGYLDCNTLRAGYPESKRVGEALCQAFIKQEQMHAVIARLPRTYGPTMLETDTKAISQFLKNGIAGDDIVLKSEGNQLYSYAYVADAVVALLLILLSGEDGQAYNVAGDVSDISLKDLALLVADHCGTKVVFDVPSDTEKAGFSKATKAVLDANKIKGLGYHMQYTMKKGVERTLDILTKTGYF